MIVVMDQSRLADERLRILSSWWMLELFSPQRIPTVTRGSSDMSDRRVVAWRPGEPTPWEILAPPSAYNGVPRVWRHTVYLGVYDIEATYESLVRVFGDDADGDDSHPDGESACAGLLIDSTGGLVADSAVLSSALWAAGRARNPGPEDPRWMEGFNGALEQFRSSVDRFEATRERPADGDRPAPHDGDSLTALLQIAHAAAGIGAHGDLASSRVVIDSVAVSTRRAEDAADTDFLNSFYLDDLRKVREQLRDGAVGSGLAAYLSGETHAPRADRIDVIAHPEAVDAGTVIASLPKGRWPSSPRHPLALSQQFAVNRAINELEAGIMGVNGPPGTGKTTMLRDVLAANVVERARRLASLPHPRRAFTDTTHRWTDGDGRDRTVRQLREDLTGFEMVVASANNAAVENITTEVPSESAIDGIWRGKADYFGDLATAILQETAADDGTPEVRTPSKAWGLVAATLGNKRNRTAFHSAFWFDKKDPKTKKPREDGTPRMQTVLTRWRDGQTPHVSWSQARERFRAAERRVDALIRQRAEAEARLAQLPRLVERERELVESLDDARLQIDGVQRDLTEHAALADRTDTAHDRVVQAHDRHLAARPGVWETLFSLGRVTRLWRVRLNDLSRDLDLSIDRQRRTRDRTLHLQRALTLHQARLSGTQRELENVRDRRARVVTMCTRDRERFGAAYPAPSRRGDQRELRAPWLDEELDTARSSLFIAALQLHQDFLANTARDMLPGLRAAIEVVAGSHPRDLAPEKIRAAWQLFFLTVPMISTTFASAGRMFSSLGPEAIGWLLIDEAGQASPQYAAGAIWRARRVVAVGDPLQLEPVSTLPPKAQHRIAAGHGISPVWVDRRTSVQTLADRVTRYGTALEQGDDRVWVSAPLRVHRRCDEPMFSLCNQIAYNGLMVNGVHRELDHADRPDPFARRTGTSGLAASHWAHEPATVAGSHLQPNQIDRFESALAYVTRQGIPPSDVIAISPYRAVADRLRSLIPKYPGLRAGTIHTAQGREAAVVILVLGGDAAKPGAPATWARTPNLVNVAASRAQRRLYVIGDREVWARHPYFSELSSALRS